MRRGKPDGRLLPRRIRIEARPTAVVPLPIPALAVLASAFDAPQRLWVEIALASSVDVGRWAVHSLKTLVETGSPLVAA